MKYLIAALVQIQDPCSPVILSSAAAATNGCSVKRKNRTSKYYISPIYSPSFYFLLTGFAEPNPVIYSTNLNGTIFFQVVLILPSTCTNCLDP